MQHQRLAGIGLLAGLAAGLLGWWLKPETGPQTTAPPPPAPPSAQLAAPVSASLSRGAEPAAPRAASAPVVPGRVPITRQADPMPPVDPDQIFVADLKGLATAAVARREYFGSCWDEYRSRVGDLPYEGRLTVKITVNPQGDRGVAETEVINGPDDDGFHACMAGVMRDAQFESPGEAPFSMMWPVPIPKSDLMGRGVQGEDDE
jgi:hypothetical protein